MEYKNKLVLDLLTKALPRAGALKCEISWQWDDQAKQLNFFVRTVDAKPQQLAAVAIAINPEALC